MSTSAGWIGWTIIGGDDSITPETVLLRLAAGRSRTYNSVWSTAAVRPSAITGGCVRTTDRALAGFLEAVGDRDLHSEISGPVLILNDP